MEKMEVANGEGRFVAQEGFLWDRQAAYLFDIDGTLLRCRDRIHVNAFLESIRAVSGREASLEGVALHGSTDTAILRDACRLAGLPDAEFARMQGAMLEAICRIVAERRAELEMVRMPAVEPTLAHLRKMGAELGLATGNLERVGWIKTEQLGLRDWFSFGGFSDDCPDRAELVGRAAVKARERAGIGASVCVVGDTPRDVAAARANGLPVIAVATGDFSFETLLACEPELCASSLAALPGVGEEQR